MAKTFERRVSKTKRKKIDLTGNLDYKLFKVNDEKLLRGAELQKVKLKDITVRKQVRTKFNDSSINELATNIKENGLIQPLVLHRENDKFVLICGERRFRAMSTLKSMKEAPCFILEDKNHEELMAIQFSENSAREALHYIDQADSIKAYQVTTGASERKIVSALGISKSEVHRSLLLSKLPKKVKESAKIYNIEKYVLLEWSKIEDKDLKKKLQTLISKGKLTKRAQLKEKLEDAPSIKKKSRVLKTTGKLKTVKKTTKKPKELKISLDSLDAKTKAKLKKLLESSL